MKINYLVCRIERKKVSRCAVTWRVINAETLNAQAQMVRKGYRGNDRGVIFWGGNKRSFIDKVDFYYVTRDI